MATENKDRELKNAFETLKAALKDSPDYYYSWQSNIAMAFVDTWAKNGYAGEDDEEKEENRQYVHNCANEAAKRFLDGIIASV